MRWDWVLALSAVGFLMGAASLYGYTHSIESWLWLLIWIFCALALAWRVGEKPFVHGAATGALMSLFNSFVQILFFDIYKGHNPDIAEAEAAVPAGYDARTFFVMLLPFIALISAMLLGLMTLAAAKMKQTIDARNQSRL